MKKTLTNLAATKSLLDVTFQEVIDELSKALGRTPKQLERIKDVIGAHYKRTATAMLLPDVEVMPLHFMNEVKEVAWESLPLETRRAVKILDDEIAGGRMPHGTILDYMAYILRTSDKSPRAPDINRLDYGAMTHLCRDMQVEPPKIPVH